MKKCPICAEEIQNEAVICRYCGKKVNKIILWPRTQKDWIIFGVIFLIIWAWQFLPKSSEQIARDQQRDQQYKDLHYAAQDVGDDLSKVSQDVHEIEVERHPEGYQNSQ